MLKRLYTGLICLIDILIVGLAFFMVAWYRSGTRVILRDYSRPFLGFLVIWVIVSLVGGKYRFRLRRNASNLLFSILQHNFIALGIVLTLVFFFKMFIYSRFIVFGTILLATILEIIILIAIYYTFRFREDNPSYASQPLVTKSEMLEKQSLGRFFELGDKHKQIEETIYSPEFPDFNIEDTVMIKLWQKYLDRNPDLFDFLSEKADLTKFGAQQTLILNSATLFNIEYIDKGSQHLFVNLHKTNDLRRLNLYFIKVNENLQNGGVFVCCGETINQRYHRFIKTYKKFIGNIFYLFDFVLRRICPKIPIAQGIYFFLTKGRDRSLSETEMLGRLYFCGFEMIDYKEINGLTYFIVKKVKEPSHDSNPSYGPLIQLQRVGKNGRIFKCYKLRTMHPYSEYLQDYMYSRNSIEDCGKFADDFRITSWGKIMRKYWIDELPQFINLFKGDVAVIGTRALSKQYLSNYPDDVREMRLRYKPGLIPVYTADKATMLWELIDSEKRYLEKRMQKPIMTDVKYLSKALYNIATRQVKSLDEYRKT